MIIEDKEISIAGRLCRIARLRAEYYEWVDDPAAFIREAKTKRIRADIFTFLQGIHDRNPRFRYMLEWDGISIVPVSTYDHWWKTQINDKTRNRVRRARKSGIEVQEVEFTDELVKGIADIYNESPLRQGKPFKHFGKDFETLKKDHISHRDNCTFLAANLNGELVGFAKIFHGRGVWNLMQIISKLSQRYKAPTNALVAKAVELCAEHNVPFLQYGVWSRRGLGDFKKRHAFERVDLPRYYVPLNARGKIALKLGLHKKISDRLPGNWVDYLAELRKKWYSQVYGPAADAQ